MFGKCKTIGTEPSSPFLAEETSVSQSGIYSSDNSVNNGQVNTKSTSSENNTTSVVNNLNNNGGKLHRRGPGRPRKDILVQAPVPVPVILTKTATGTNKAIRRGGGTGNRIVKRM